MILRYHLLSKRAEEILTRSAEVLSTERPDIWRGTAVRKLEHVDLTPLSRIGGEEGHGGSRVYVAAFSGLGKQGDRVPSFPLLVKVVENDAKKASQLHAALAKYQIVKDLLAPQHHAEPIPVPKSRTKTIGILWSRFVDDRPLKGLPDRAPRELMNLLEEGQWLQAKQSLEATYGILANAHAGKHGAIDYVRHYRRYLRLHKGWLRNLRNTVGHSEKIRILGVRTANPLKFFTTLRASGCRGPAKLGVVHGDLHPRNVLVGHVVRASLIDFEWVRRRFHVIVDYVLMEMSIKFFYLPWSLPQDALVKFEGVLTDTFHPRGSVGNTTLDGALKVIRVLRRQAERHLVKDDPYWFERQYQVPLFLVTMGTFAFAASVRNLEHLILGAAVLADRLQDVRRQLL